MLDMLNVHGVRRDATCEVFERTDPRQTALRTLLGSFSERELTEIEQDLAYYAQTGAMSARIEALLANIDEEFADVA